MFRRVLALLCCLGQVGFGLLAGSAHVHGPEDHHELAGGLHLDHAHPDRPLRHAHAYPVHDHCPLAGDTVDHAVRRGAHDHHEPIYLTAAAIRPASPDVRPAPPGVLVLTTGLGRPPAARPFHEVTQTPDEDSPRLAVLRPRAPPAV